VDPPAGPGLVSRNGVLPTTTESFLSNRYESAVTARILVDKKVTPVSWNRGASCRGKWAAASPSCSTHPPISTG
jgi:hypothetical protein